MGRPDVAGDRRLRLASSSPDVKALFNSQPYIYDYEEHDDSQQPNYVPGPSLEYWTQLPPIVCILVHPYSRRLTSECRDLESRIAQGIQTMRLRGAQIRF
jgi:hypothetical protein